MMESGRTLLPHRHSTEHGFTLIELLVALVIFAMLAAAGVLLLGNAVSAQGQVRDHLDEQGAMLRVVSLIDQDMREAVPRISRTESGSLAPVFFAREPGDDEPFLQFVRGGWANIDNVPRSDLQKVEYWLRGHRLERRTYPLVDGSEGSGAALLIDHVENIRTEFRDDDGAWTELWQNPDPTGMPSAVRIVVTQTGVSPLTLMFRVGTGPARGGDTRTATDV